MSDPIRKLIQMFTLRVARDKQHLIDDSMACAPLLLRAYSESLDSYRQCVERLRADARAACRRKRSMAKQNGSWVEALNWWRCEKRAGRIAWALNHEPLYVALGLDINSSRYLDQLIELAAD